MKNSFKTLSLPELRVKREELVRKYLDFRFQLVIGHVDNPLQKRELRRQLARVNCLVRQHELLAEQAKEQQKPVQQEQAAADSSKVPPTK